VNPIFIIGCPRSGTTWLQRMCGKHPDVYMARARDVGILESGPGHETHAYQRMPAEEASPQLEGLIGQHPGKVVMEKTPGHALYINEILATMENPGFLFIHRNPYAVAASWMNTFSGHPPTEGAEKYVATMEKVAPHLDKPYLHRVEYEDLLENAPYQLIRLFQWMGLQPFPADVCIAVDTTDILRKGEADSWETELNPKMKARVAAVLEAA